MGTAAADRVNASTPAVPTIDGVPAGMPYVVAMPKDWPTPARDIDTKTVAKILRTAVLPAWFPGVKFSVRTDYGSMYSGVNISWADGPSDSAVALVTGQWQGVHWDGMTESSSYTGAVLHVNGAGAVAAYNLPGVSISRHRDVSPAGIEQARVFLSGVREELIGQHSGYYSPFGQPWYGGGVDDCARWLATMGVDQDTRDVRGYGPKKPSCLVGRCSLVFEHRWPAIHRDGYGRAFFSADPGDQGGDGGEPTTPGPVVPPAPPAAPVDSEPADPAPAQGFTSWQQLAEHIDGGRPALVEATGPAREATGTAPATRAGYVCKRCGKPSPTGVGYVDNSDGAAERSDGLTRCECGHSQSAADQDRPARGSVAVAGLVAGDMVHLVGIDQFGSPSHCDGYVQGAPSEVTVPGRTPAGKRSRDPKKARPGLLVQLAENEDGWNGWRMTIVAAPDGYAERVTGDAHQYRPQLATGDGSDAVHGRCTCGQYVPPSAPSTWAAGRNRWAAHFREETLPGAIAQAEQDAEPTAEAVAPAEVLRQDALTVVSADPELAAEVDTRWQDDPEQTVGERGRRMDDLCAQVLTEHGRTVKGFQAADAVRHADQAAETSTQNATAAAEIAERNPAAAVLMAEEGAERTAVAEPHPIPEIRPAATVQAWVTAHVPDAPADEPGPEAPAPEGDPVARWERLAWALVNAIPGSLAVDRRRFGDLAMCRVHGISDPGQIEAARQADPRDWPILCAAYWDAYARVLAEGGEGRVLSSEPEPAAAGPGSGGEGDDQDAPAAAGGVAATHPAPDGRMVKRPKVGNYIHTDAHGVCEVVAVHGRGGEDIGVRNAAGERRSLTRHPRAYWLVVDAPADSVQADDEDDAGTSDDDPRSIYRLPVEAYTPELDSDADAEITIRHDHEDGTVIEGSSRGDGVWEIAKAHGLECRRGVIFKRHTRDRFADLSALSKLAGALREAGHTVAVEVDDVWRPAADREDARAVRVSERAERLAERASRQYAEAHARRMASRSIADGMPFGEPIKVGHHSERAHRRAFERMESNDRASYAARDYAEELARRADAAERNEASRQGPRAIMRRVDTLKTDRRAWIRRLADTDKGATGYARTCRLYIERLSEDIAFQQSKLGDLAATGVFVAWSAESVQRGDLVNVGGSWHEVARVNRKGVSVRALYQWHTRDDITPVTWDQIHGRRRDGVQHDTPNGEGWLVEQAALVARWAGLVSRYQTCTSYDSGDSETMRRRHNVSFAVRIVLGVDTMASFQEVAAYGEPASVAGKRARALACLTVFERLEAGERVPDVAASVTPIADTVPRWTMPKGEPVEVFPRDLAPGDIVAGVFDDMFGARRLSTSIVGPVTAAPRHLDRRESGDWEVITVDGQEHEVRSFRRFAVHQAAGR